MTEQSPPSFEDLEPEGEVFIEPVPPTDAQGEFLMGSLGEYAFRDLDEFEGYEQLGPPSESETLMEDAFEDSDGYYDTLRHQRPQRTTLPTRAARIALKWGGRATQNTLRKANNGRRAGASTVTDQTTGMCSAAVSEARELMEAMATAAARTEDQAEAMGLAAAMVPVALGLAPKAYRGLWPAVPALVRGVMGVTKLLHGRPETRPHLQLLPKIMQETTKRLAQQALQGHSSSRPLAAKILSNVTGAALSGQKGARSRRRRSRRSRPRYYDEF